MRLRHTPHWAPVTEFGHKITFRHATFPLPYHHNSYVANLGILAVLHLLGKPQDPSIYLKAINVGFGIQEGLYNKATINVTQYEVLEYLSSNLASPMGVDGKAFIAAMLDPNQTLDQILREQWKYAIYSKRVYGTPSFLMNGVAMPSDAFSWNITQWRTFLQQYAA